jgi:hypothetical protein
MSNNKDFGWKVEAVVFAGFAVIAIITAMVIQYKTNLAYIEAGYSQDGNNRWVKVNNCNCPPNNPQQPEKLNDRSR